MSDPVYAVIRAFEQYRLCQTPDAEAALKEALWVARQVIDDELRKRVGMRSIADEQAIQRAYADAYPARHQARDR